MKIDSVNFVNYYAPQYRGRGNFVQNTQNQQFDYSLAESIGRSQVNFTGQKDKKYQQYDEMFIDTVAQNLRLSDEDKQRLTDDIDTFLKANNFKSLEAIAGEKHIEEQDDFIAEVGDDICKSDFDFNILSSTFQKRMFYEGEYEPIADKYEKDYEVVDHILDKYDIDQELKGNIFDILKEQAGFIGGETVFDLFMPENKPQYIMGVLRDQLHLNNDLSVDLLIDFGLMAQKDDEARREGIYPWKMTALMNEQAKDEAIACEIIDEYDLEGDEFYEGDIEDVDDEFDDEFDDDDDDEEAKSTMNEIAEQLNRRRSGVSVEQISYELMEKYDLPSEAYEFIKNTIYEYDADEL